MNEFSEWMMKNFDERQRKQILWARLYDQDMFRHGDNGHNDKIIIAKMSHLIDELEARIASHDTP